MHRVPARLNVVAQQVAAEDLHPGLGVERGQGALYRLRPPGRARGVLHELPGDPVYRRSVRAAGQRDWSGVKPGDRVASADGDASGLGHAALVGRCVGDGGEPLVRHQGLGAGVSQDVRDLGHREVAVERDEVPPGLEQSHEHDEDLGPVGQQHRHRITRLQPSLAQARARAGWPACRCRRQSTPAHRGRRRRDGPGPPQPRPKSHVPRVVSPRQPQHVLTHDVLVDLGRPAGDGGLAHGQQIVAPEVRVHQRVRAR